MSSDELREKRRKMSSWLTDVMNKTTNSESVQNAVRAEVLQALSLINKRVGDLNSHLSESSMTIENKPLVKFYMKGGNAYAVTIDPEGDQAKKQGGKDSDWDTQVIYDPWTPTPLEGTITGFIEKLVINTLQDCAEKVAKVIKGIDDQFFQKIETEWNTGGGRTVDGYNIKYTAPQTILEVFSHEKTGLWLDTQQPMNPNSENPNLLPGLILSDAIAPFVIYRLGYNWQAVAQENIDPIDKPLLMELIDVTIPRPNTVEAVEVWQEIEQKEVEITEEEVTVLVKKEMLDQPKGAELPLPDLMYHLREQLTMLSEIADGSSEHVDKWKKRIDRALAIRDKEGWQNKTDKAIFQQTGEPVANINDQIAGLVNGVNALLLANPSDPSILEELKKKITANLTKIGTYEDQEDQGYKNLKYMMYKVAQSAITQLKAIFNDLKQETDDTFTPPRVVYSIKTEKLQAFQQSWNNFKRSREMVILSAFADSNTILQSGNLPLLHEVAHSSYMDPFAVGWSPVQNAALIRVAKYQNLIQAKERLDSQKDTLSQNNITYETRLTTNPITEGLANNLFTVFFYNDKPTSLITLTDMPKESLPTFLDINNNRYAPLAEIGRQNKMGGGYILDYTVRTAMSRHLRAVNTLMNLT